MKRLFLSVLTVSALLGGVAFAEQRINPMTGQYEVIRPGDKLQFNAPAGTYSYAAPGSRPELNRSTMQWEFPGQSRQLPADPVPYEFRQYQRDVDRMEREQERYYPGH